MDGLAPGLLAMYVRCFLEDKIPSKRIGGGGEETDVTAVPSLKRCFYGECFGFRFWIPVPHLPQA